MWNKIKHFFRSIGQPKIEDIGPFLSATDAGIKQHNAQLDELEEEANRVRAKMRLLEIQGTPRGRKRGKNN